ncbi:MAG: 4-hydroxybenzoate octaprenyltransferase [Gammaproteobacteria bacterium]|nr:4-hydroxybenzoate octaprenyltransferase [Gammaproteobacteria bacterium]
MKAYLNFFTTLNHKKIADYIVLMRFNRPIGIFLLLWPTLWALWIAAEGFPGIVNFLVFCAGVPIMRSAGCVINDYADRNLDGHVKRTSTRPIPACKVSPEEALVLFFLLLFVAFLLVLTLNRTTIYLAFAGVGLTIFYPFAKRFTWFPQVALGITFSWSIPMAFAAEQKPLSELTWIIYFTNLIWVIFYDTIYAMVDREYDLKVGIKSTAILFGEADRFMVGMMQLMVIVGLAILGNHLNFGWVFVTVIVMVAVLFAGQQMLIRKRDPDDCFRAFLNNNYVGMIIFLGILIEYYIK